MEQKAINLKTLTMDELAGVVNLYPWYGAARKELCRRMAGVGGESWGVSQFSDQAMYVGDRGSIAEIMHKGDGADYSDKGLEALLSSYIEEKKKERYTMDRLWTYLGILPQLSKEGARKLKTPDKLFQFPWEVEDRKKKNDKEFDEIKDKMLAFFNDQEAKMTSGKE